MLFSVPSHVKSLQCSTKVQKVQSTQVHKHKKCLCGKEVQASEAKKGQETAKPTVSSGLGEKHSPPALTSLSEVSSLLEAQSFSL